MLVSARFTERPTGIVDTVYNHAHVIEDIRYAIIIINITSCLR
jgi:hypothetical protein